MKASIGTCGICHLTIRGVDDYVMVDEYIKGIFKSKGFYHRNCFRDRLMGKAELAKLQAKANWILDKVAEKVE